MAENNTNNQQGQYQEGSQNQYQAGPQDSYQGGPQGPYQGGTQGQYQGGPQNPYQGAPQGQYGAPVHPQAPTNMNENNLPSKYQPISMWGYFGYQFLFGLPVIGLILAIVWSFSSENINRRNYARSQFCWLIIYLVIFAVIIAVVGGLGALFARY